MRIWRLLGIAAALLGAPAATAQEQPRVVAVSASFAGRDLRVRASLSPPLPAELERRLGSGLPTTVVWRVGLYGLRTLWFDGRKDERRYEVTATYRPVSGDYTVERRLDARLLESAIVPGREEAAHALSQLSGLPCFTMGPHLLGKRMVVKASASFAAGVSLGVVPATVETSWTRSEPFEWRGEGRGTPP